jgi:hypothetical protein
MYTLSGRWNAQLLEASGEHVGVHELAIAGAKDGVAKENTQRKEHEGFGGAGHLALQCAHSPQKTGL